jgi:tetratricopeptide (TPR) repeat protein
MFRVTSLTQMPEQQLSRWIKRIALLAFLVLVAFVGFYAVDRFRMPTASMADRELTTLEAAVRADPTDIASRGRLADLYLVADRYDEAIAQYTEILATGKQDKAAYVSRARAEELKGDLPAATADYTKIVEMATGGEMANVDPVLQVAYYGLGSIALTEGRAQDAIDNATKALAIKRSDADAMYLLGAAHVAAGTPEEALEPLRSAIAFVPIGWPEPYLALADAYAATGDAAHADWAKAMALVETDPAAAEAALTPLVDGDAGVDARVGLAVLKESGGDTAAAGDWYRRALELEPENDAALLGLSRVTDPADASPAASPAASVSTEGSN